jgi:spoIIIJ-associated protein
VAELLERLGFAADIYVRYAEPASDEEEGPLVLDVRGGEVNALIGRRGETLAALQRIVRLIVGRRMASRVNLVVDVEGFKQKRERNLRRLAEQMAEQALEENRTIFLEPMPAYERRIVHLALRERTDVRTESIGEGYRRRVTVIPQPEERG